MALSQTFALPREYARMGGDKTPYVACRLVHDASVADRVQPPSFQHWLGKDKSWEWQRQKLI